RSHVCQNRCRAAYTHAAKSSTFLTALRTGTVSDANAKGWSSSKREGGAMAYRVFRQVLSGTVLFVCGSITAAVQPAAAATNVVQTRSGAVVGDGSDIWVFKVIHTPLHLSVS